MISVHTVPGNRLARGAAGDIVPMQDRCRKCNEPLHGKMLQEIPLVDKLYTIFLLPLYLPLSFLLSIGETAILKNGGEPLKPLQSRSCRTEAI